MTFDLAIFLHVGFNCYQAGVVVVTAMQVHIFGGFSMLQINEGKIVCPHAMFGGERACTGIVLDVHPLQVFIPLSVFGGAVVAGAVVMKPSYAKVSPKGLPVRSHNEFGNNVNELLAL